MSLSLHHKFHAHKDKAWSLSIHPKLPIAASASTDRTCQLYNLESLTEVTKLDENTHTKTIRCVCFKPSNTEQYPTLALGSFDSTSSIWGADDAHSIWELLAVIEGHENEVKSISWSSDGKYLATCARDKTVWVWETDDTNEEFECIAVLQDHEQDVKYVLWHGINPKLFASCSYDETCRVWRQDSYDEDEWVCSTVLKDDCTIWGCAWEKTDTLNERLITGNDNGVLKLFGRTDNKENDKEKENGTSQQVPSTIREEEEWRLLKILPEVHEGPVYSIDWNETGVVSCGSDGKIVIYTEKDDKWEVETEKIMAHGVYEINSVKWYGKDKVLSCGDDGCVCVWTLNLNS